MSKIDFKLVIEIMQVLFFIVLSVYWYTLLGFTLYQAVLAECNTLFGMAMVAFYTLKDRK